MRVSWSEGLKPAEPRDPDPSDICHLDMLWEDWEADEKRPHHAIRTMVYCHDAMVRPPDWVTQAISECLAEYLDAGGSRSLDECFAEKPQGRGRQRRLAEAENHARTQHRGHLMAVCVEIFDIPIEKAAEAVTRRLEEEGQQVSADYLEDQYRRKSRPAVSDAWRAEWRSRYEPTEARRAFIQQFPADVQPLFLW